LAHEDHSHSLVAIVFGAAAFEGWLASVVTHAQRHSEYDPAPTLPAADAIADILPAMERSNAQWLLKLQVAAVLLSGRLLDRGKQPWQDIDLLFRIRNVIVHPSLTWLPAATDEPDSKPHILIRELVSRRIVDEPRPIPGLPGPAEEFRELHPPPTSVLLQPQVAAWAERTAVAGLDGVVALCPRSTFRQQLEWWLTMVQSG
jgi:hypothetical protein